MMDVSIGQAWGALKQACESDPEFAWAVHCNIAMPIIDAIGVSHEQSNVASAHLMQHLFDHDITTHERFEYQKSGAQEYAEIRIAAEQAEDAA
jgi:hypothetical protein